MNVAILAGGCYWCTEAVFQRINGVEDVQPGFCGGTIKNPAYREVIQGRTGHAESVKITFDSSVVSYIDLLKVFFATHDPTTLNRQGHDIGDHYRSAIFYTDLNQQQLAIDYINYITDCQLFDSPIVTQVTAATDFYPTDGSHTNYYNNNKQQGYCQYVIDPKIKKLFTTFPDQVKHR